MLLDDPPIPPPPGPPPVLVEVVVETANLLPVVVSDMVGELLVVPILTVPSVFIVFPPLPDAEHVMVPPVRLIAPSDVRHRITSYNVCYTKLLRAFLSILSRRAFIVLCFE